MHKTLAVLWSIILLGAVYISVNLFKPDSALEQQIQYEELAKQENLDNLFNQNKEEEEQSPTEESDESTKETDSIASNKTYSAHLELGELYYNEGDFEKAVSELESAASINPNSSTAFLKLGYAYLKNNQTNEAKTAFEQAFNLNSNSIDVQIGLVRANIDTRALTEAETLLVNMNEGYPETVYYKAILAILKNENDKAKDYFDRLAGSEEISSELKEKVQFFLDAYTNFEVFTDSESIYLDALLAKALGQADEYQAGIIVGLDIVNQMNNYRDAWIILGYNYLAVEKARDAIDALSKAEDLSPEKPETLFYLGLAYFANNDLDNAIAYLEKAYKNGFEPKDEVNLKLGDIYLLQESYDKAAFRYEKVLTQNTSNIDVFVKAIWLNIDQIGNHSKALKLAEKAVEKFPDNAMAYNLLGWAQLSIGEYSDAEKNLTASLNLNPQLDATNLNFGLLYEKQGNVILAKDFYKKAYLLGRGNSIARRAAVSYNNLTKQDMNQYYQVDIAAP